MDLEIGIVCARCDTYSAIGTKACAACGHDLALFPPAQLAPPFATSKSAQFPAAPVSVGRPPMKRAETHDHLAAQPASKAADEAPVSDFYDEELKPRRRVTPAPRAKSPGPSAGSYSNTTASDQPPAARPLAATSPSASAPESADLSSHSAAAPPAQHAPLTLEELMDQAKNFVCRSCSTPVPVGHKFCGRCGAAIPPEILGARTQFFGQLQAPGKAKLILIRGEGVEGLSYQLNAEQHIVGRNGQLVFPDDPFVSPKHANLFYRNGKLVVRDEGSMNGVFLRVRGTIEVSAGDQFLAGEQLFRVDATPKASDGPAQDGTYFYSSPKHQSPFRVTQILQGGAPGMTVCARSSGLQIGREGGDLNFPTDLYMSASHCKLEESGGKISLTDVNSRNGSFIRLKSERELAHGDYLFIGRKLLRVEITAA